MRRDGAGDRLSLRGAAAHRSALDRLVVNVQKLRDQTDQIELLRVVRGEGGHNHLEQMASMHQCGRRRWTATGDGAGGRWDMVGGVWAASVWAASEWRGIQEGHLKALVVSRCS